LAKLGLVNSGKVPLGQVTSVMLGYVISG